jgi:hypothetical protein
VGYLDVFIKNLLKGRHAELKAEFFDKFLSMVQKASSSFQSDLRASYLKVVANLKDDYTSLGNRIDFSPFFDDLDCSVRQALIVNLHDLYDIMDKTGFTETFFNFCQKEFNVEIVRDIGRAIKPLFDKIFLFDFKNCVQAAESKRSIQLQKSAVTNETADPTCQIDLTRSNITTCTCISMLRYFSKILKTIRLYQDTFKQLGWRSLYDFYLFFRDTYIETFLKKICIESMRELMKNNDCQNCFFEEFIGLLKTFNIELIDYLIDCLVASNFENSKFFAEIFMSLYGCLIFEGQKRYCADKIKEIFLRANSYQLRIRYLVLYEAALVCLSNGLVKDLFLDSIGTLCTDKVEAVRLTWLKL